jgi:hypothetical protein
MLNPAVNIGHDTNSDETQKKSEEFYHEVFAKVRMDHRINFCSFSGARVVTAFALTTAPAQATCVRAL